jgi:hypothetical protein
MMLWVFSPLSDRVEVWGIEGGAVNQASARVREQMTFDKKRSNLVNQIISSD